SAPTPLLFPYTTLFRSEHGNFLELRFKDLQEPHKNYLRQRIAAEGISPGWKRKFPRIPVSQGGDSNLPVPSLCMVRFVGQEIFRSEEHTSELQSRENLV